MRLLSCVVLLLCIGVAPIATLAASSTYPLVGIKAVSLSIVNEFKLCKYNTTGEWEVIGNITELNLYNAMAYIKNQETVLYPSITSLSGPVYLNTMALNGTQANSWGFNWLWGDMAYDTQTNQVFVGGFQISNGDSDVIFELLSNGTLRKIIKVPGNFQYQTVTAYNSKEHIWYFLTGSESLASIDTQQGKILANPKIQTVGPIQLMAYDDTTGLTYVWVMNQTKSGRELLLQTLNVTTAEAIETIGSVTQELHGKGGVMVIDSKDQMMYTSLLRNGEAYWVTTDLKTRNIVVSSTPLKGIDVCLKLCSVEILTWEGSRARFESTRKNCVPLDFTVPVFLRLQICQVSLERPKKHKRGEEEAEEPEAKSQDLGAIIQASIDKGEATVFQWQCALDAVKEKSDLSRTRASITNMFPGPFADTPVEAVARSVKLMSLLQEEGDDWRYDRTKASATFTLAMKGQTFLVAIDMNYSQQDGINLLLRIQQESESNVVNHMATLLVDCSGDYPHDYWDHLWVEHDDLTKYLRNIGLIQAEISSPEKEFVQCMCWLFTALIAGISPAAETLENENVKEKVSAALQKIVGSVSKRLA